MKINIELDTNDRSKAGESEAIRSLAGYLLHLIGDLDAEEVEPATLPPPPPPPPVVPTGTEADDNEDRAESNVVNFPVPPPPPPPNTMTADFAAPNLPPPLISLPAAPVVGASTAVSAPAAPNFGVDSSGMQYDARIHQKTGNKKKDGTWKLIKGIDAALVSSVTAELAARKGASAPVSLPSTVPVPPVPNVPAPPPVHIPAAPAPVPVPPPPAPGAVPPPPPAGDGAQTFRGLIDTITTATKAGKITPGKVAEICQKNGVPNLMQLNNMPDKLSVVTTGIELAILGLE